MAERKIPESKIKKVEEIASLIKKNNTLLIVSTVNLPSGQFQEIRKKIRDKAEIRVIKKNLVIKAFESLGGGVLQLKDHVSDNTALIFSQLDPFQVAAILSENKSPAKAKMGQIATADISVEPGPTDLVPGPAITELQSLGLKIAIEEGKITIREGKAIVKEGQPVSEAAASLMSKLNITPFKIGFAPLAAYSNKDHKLYKGIKVDKYQTIQDFKAAYAKALAFAVSIAYSCRETISYLLAKAAMHEKALIKLIKTESAVQPAPRPVPTP